MHTSRPPKGANAAALGRANDRRAQATLGPLLAALAVQYDVPMADIRRRRTYPERTWAWSYYDRPPSVRARYARWIAYRVLHEADVSYAAIGRAMGTDHTTVIHGIRRLETDPELADDRLLTDALVDRFARTRTAVAS